MITFIRRLKSAWNYLALVPYDLEADAEDFWGQEDRRAYTAFMKSPTGQKLAARLTNLRLQSAVNAAAASSNTKYRNGWATSVAATLSFLDDHLAAAEPEPEEQVQSKSEQDFEEKFRP